MITVYLLVIWFTILLFSNKNYFYCSLVILTASLANIILIDVLGLTNAMTYIQEKGVLIKIDGITAIILTLLYYKDKLALRMSLLLAFSVLCHTMLIYDLTIHSSFVSNLFYLYYDELIITIGILQMVISRDGITSALRNIRDHLLRISFYSWCYSKSLSSFKRSGERT
jgi:hypothetical protein